MSKIDQSLLAKATVGDVAVYLYNKLLPVQPSPCVKAIERDNLLVYREQHSSSCTMTSLRHGKASAAAEESVPPRTKLLEI